MEILALIEHTGLKMIARLELMSYSCHTQVKLWKKHPLTLSQLTSNLSISLILNAQKTAQYIQLLEHVPLPDVLQITAHVLGIVEVIFVQVM